jgi:hypothetical protein
MHPLPRHLAEALARRLDLKVAVETGTYLGDTAALLRQFFSEVWTIELSDDLHGRAQARYRHLAGVHFLQGSSAEILPKVAGEIGQPALFWLDGHWTADSASGSTAGEEQQCPVMEEIAAIDAYDWSERSCILIDDARLFLGPPAGPYRREDWPPFLEVLTQLRAQWPRFVTVLDDVIIAGPPESRPVVEDYWLGVLSRKEDDHSRLVEALNPPPLTAARRLIKAVLPSEVIRLYRTLRYRTRRPSDHPAK